MGDHETTLDSSDKPESISQTPLNIIKSHSTTSKVRSASDIMDSLLPHAVPSDGRMVQSSRSQPALERPTPKPRTKLSAKSTYYPSIKEAPSTISYHDVEPGLKLHENERDSKPNDARNTMAASEDPTQDSATNSYDEDNFRKIFGIDPRDLASGEVGNHKPSFSNERSDTLPENWFKRKNCNCPGHNQALVKATDKKNNRWSRFKNGLRKGLTTTVRYIASCCILCYVVTPPIPSLVTKKIAFHPPSGCNYCFVVKNEATGEEVAAVAKDAYGKTVIRIEVELPREFVSPQFQDSPLDDVEGFVVKTRRDNYLACVYVPCRSIDRAEEMKKKVIIFCQPNSSNLNNFMWRNHGISIISFRDIANLSGADVYAFDYSGFGISSGTTLEKNIYADITAVFDYVRQQRPDCEIFIMGFSLGTAAAIHLASCQPEGLAGLILMAPFTSGLRVLCNQPERPESYFTDAFRSFEKAPLVDVPVLINHGVRDSVIPMSHAVSLLKRFHKPVPIELVPDRDHITIMRPLTNPVFLRIANFLMFEAPEYHKKFDKPMIMKDLNEKLDRLKKATGSGSKRHKGLNLD